jgi:acyl-CoA reductase-like NAD-dependent aldehyde dehydrogenase
MTGVDPDAPVMKEEVFGPVLPVSAFDTVADAIDMANATRFGLGASIWTHDMRTISQATRELDAGIVWVNQHLRIPPEVPFGGVKSSGLGRENGRYALLQYLEEKTILINP